MSVFGKEGEKPSERLMMDIASKWMNDPLGTRELFVYECLGHPTPERPATIPEIIDAMKRATMSHASALAWMRGEHMTMGGPVVQCKSCTEYIEQVTNSPQPEPLQSQTIWMGKDTGGWRCLVCGSEVEQTTPIPEPFIPPNLKDLPN